MRRTLVAYLTSYGVSLLGNSITAIALPLLVLFTTGSALSAGIVAIAVAVPAAVAGILMGALIDVVNRRTAAIVANVVSGVALALLPIIDMTVGLTLGWFVAVAVLSSIGDVPGITAREAMLPSVAAASGMETSRLIGTREAISAVSLLVGPAIAGFLVAALEPVTVMWFTAGISLLAAVISLGIPARATAVSASEVSELGTAPVEAQPGRSALHGLKVIVRSPVLRSLILLTLALGATLAAVQGIVIPVHFAFQDQAQHVGFVLSALAAGLLVGGVTFASSSEKLSRRTWFGLGVVLVSIGFVVIATLGHVSVLLAGALIVGLGGGCLNSVIGVTFIERTRDAERGRVLGAENALLTLFPGAGIALAALLIEFGSLQVATVALTAMWVVAATAALLSRTVRRI
jgi:MFS family permease